ncbi:23S ribosomal RNA methyltransferase Erm [Paenibacillaceae bacterium WGS1546]|uniref:23S ribosomal RNA methyltransferase Erm n=1 Tax=Cohnella sp. WGS1546 TaxID=3366810 RepID=UPI00372D835E
MTRRKPTDNSNKISRGDPPNFLGQHFMHAKKLIREIVDQARISRSDTVLELGAGKGALTEALAQKAGKVLAVEYDRRLIESLQQKIAPYGNIKIIRQDILKLHLPKENFVVVSNIPYSITTPIMKMLLNHPNSGFQRGVLIMEQGAAKRFTAKTVKDPYVAAWRMWFDFCYVKTVQRQCFSPPPKVDSAMLFITRKAKPLVPAKDGFLFHGLAEHMLRAPKSTIDASVHGILTPPQVKYLKRSLNLKEAISVESLTEAQWGIIFDTMVKHVPRFRWPKARNKARSKKKS